MNFHEIISELDQGLDRNTRRGEVASYIPELARVDADKYGFCLCRLNGEIYQFGDYLEKFSTQSITKVFSLAMAMNHFGAKIWKRIDVEPSGTPFNSLVQLEYEEGIPRNPFINSGALVIADMLIACCRDPKGEFLSFVRKLSGSNDIDYNYAVAESEKSRGYRNKAMINMLKSFGNIHHDVDEVLDLYYHQCAIAMSCQQLARAFLVFANAGKLPDHSERIISKQQSQRINALMLTCGFYDEAGEFAFRVGLPGKSGVGGGIVAIHPGEYSVAVWSPRLNPQGNSVLGMKTLEMLTTKIGTAIF